MVALDINNVSLALAVVGGYIISVGLISYLLKERLFMCQFRLRIHPIVC